MEIFDGKKIAEEILTHLKEEVGSMKRKPGLAVIFVGDNPESELYVENKKKAAKEIGIRFSLFRFRDIVKEEIIIKKIKELNKDTSIDGIIVQLPLPEEINTNNIVSAILPQKDVDGFHKENRKLLKAGDPYFVPVLPAAIEIALQKVPGGFVNKKIVAIVNSDIFGETLKDFLKREDFKLEMLVRDKCLISDIKKKISQSDIVISVCGKPRYIKGDFLKKRVSLIDAGIKLMENKIVGDVDRKSVERKASFLTPVPGGIGPLVVALLLNNVYLSSIKKR